MKLIHTFLLVLSVAAIGSVTGCSQNQSEIDQWHTERISSLEEEDSWLSLVGLYPLKKDTYSFGSDSANDFVFPPKAAANIGTITRDGDSFYIDIRSEIEVTTSEGDNVNELITGANEESSILSHRDLQWHIIERRDNYYLRLKDTNHPNFSAFEGIERFPLSQKWKVEATFNRFSEPRTITIPDILVKSIRTPCMEG